MDVMLGAHKSAPNTSGSVPSAAARLCSIAHEAAEHSLVHEKV